MRPYRTRKGIVGLSTDSQTKLARMSAYVPGSGGRERKRETVFATYDRRSYLDQGGTTPLLRAYAIDCPRCSC
jgi:hypothetical protein